MDEKVMAVIGAATAMTVAGRGLRPLAKVLMRGVVAASEATAAGRRSVQELYAEAKAERARAAPQPGPTQSMQPSSAPATGTAEVAG
jgi:predicted RNA-binding Zn ribbon-like protein